MRKSWKAGLTAVAAGATFFLTSGVAAHADGVYGGPGWSEYVKDINGGICKAVVNVVGGQYGNYAQGSFSNQNTYSECAFWLERREYSPTTNRWTAWTKIGSYANEPDFVPDGGYTVTGQYWDGEHYRVRACGYIVGSPDEWCSDGV